MKEPTLIGDGHGPAWASAIAELADRAAAAFGRTGAQGCLSVVDLEPWRRMDAWWLRRRLESLSRLSGRPVRYVPCVGQGHLPRGRHITAFAAAWAVGTPPQELCWPSRNKRPHRKAGGQPWVPDGPVVMLAGDLAQRLPQEVLLSHHGNLQQWGGAPGAGSWQPFDLERHAPWVAASLHAYVSGLPSSMLAFPAGYWRFLEQALAWAVHGCVVVSRAAGWSTLADIREDTTQRAEQHADSAPVNFHWLAQQLPRLGARTHMARAHRADAVQLVATGLPDADTVLPLLAEPLSAATQAPRADRARAVRLLAAGGDLDAALSVLQLASDDPAMLRAAGDALAAAPKSPAASAQLGAWLERAMADNPWISEDSALLRAAGHLALACGRLDLARTALRALDALGRALGSDLAALACCLERLGCLEAAMATCERALSREPGQPTALAIRRRAEARLAAMAAPWRVQHGHADSLLMLDPLHADHAPMLLRQMRDPSIASMTALPALAPGDDGQAWIKGRLEDGAQAYAMVHRQLGFVGYLDLRIWQSTAFICYWIGADFQGLGLCAPAAALGCDLAVRNGIDLLLSSAYDDNVRSLRALRKCGFSPMAVRALPPDADRTFVMRTLAPMGEDEARQRLIDFCGHTGSGLRFAVAAGDGFAETSCTTTGPGRAD